MAEPSVHTRLTDSETVYERLFESLPYAILVVDSGGRIIRANPQVERFFGYTNSELLGNLVEILIPERFRQVHPTHRAHFNEQPRMRPIAATSTIVSESFLFPFLPCASAVRTYLCWFVTSWRSTLSEWIRK
jgi:PAS domain-containing protein